MTLYNEIFKDIICPDCLTNLSFKISIIDKRHCRCNKITIDYYSEYGCYLYIKDSATLLLQHIGVDKFKILLVRKESSIYYEPLINIYKLPFEYLYKEEFIKNLNEMLKSIYKIKRNLLFI